MQELDNKEKPLLFVGSSSETIQMVRKATIDLTNSATVYYWDENKEDPALESYFKNIMIKIQETDYAMFIFCNSDTRIKGETEERIPRDNVILEAGLAIGILGKKRVFFVKQKGTTLPTNLAGQNIIEYDNENDLTSKVITIGNKMTLEPDFPVALQYATNTEIDEGVKRAKNLWIISPMLSSFLDKYEADILDRLKDNLESFIAVVRDPFGDTINLITSHNEQYNDPREVHSKVVGSLRTLQKLQRQYPQKVKIFVLNHPFICSSYVFDPHTSKSKVCVRYNPYGEVSRLPEIFSNNKNKFWNDFFIKQAEEYIRSSKDYPAKIVSIDIDDICDFEEKLPLMHMWKDNYGENSRGMESIETKLVKGTKVILAKDGDNLVGFSVIDKKTGKRKATVVLGKYRRRKIATNMVQHSMNSIPEQFSELHCNVSGMDKVLEKLHFKPTSQPSLIKRLSKYDIESNDFKFKGNSVTYIRQSTTGDNSIGEFMMYCLNYK